MNIRSAICCVGAAWVIGAPTINVHAEDSPRALPEAHSNLVTVTSARGSTLTIDSTRFHIYDIPTARFEELTGISPDWQTVEPPLAQVAARQVPLTGRVVTLLVEWDNHSANPLYHPREAYDSLLYSDGIYPTGSVNDYYQEVSYGNFSVLGEVVGWLTLPSSYNGWYDMQEIVDYADPFVNFADYDGNGDGDVDALWLIHAGPGQEETHDPFDIWSHAMLGANVTTSDGVRINRWSVQPEQYVNGEIMTVRVFAHEYGHILGLPDLYDYDDKLFTPSYYILNDYNDHPLVDWDVMGYAGYNMMSYGTAECPTHFSAWSRTVLGWGAPEVPACLDGTYQLYNVETYPNQSILKVPISDDGSEYFYLEYRNPRSTAKFDHLNSDFSAYFPSFTPGKDTLDAGLLITQIDDKVGPNNGTPGQPHYAVRVVDAGYDPGHPWDGVSEFSEWWCPYEFRIGALFSPDDPGQTILSPSTTPSSDGYDGPSGITIEVVAQNSEFLTINISRPSRPVLDPAAPVTMVELEVQNINLTATDWNCTTPSFALAGSPPAFAALNDLGTGSATLTLSPQVGDAGVTMISVVASDGSLADTTGVQVTVTSACVCPWRGDFDANGVLDPLDLNALIDALFFGGVNPQEPNCPATRGDFDNNGVPDPLDLNAMIEFLFFGGVGPCDPCDPVQSSCAI